MKSYSSEDIIDEITSSTIAECVDETNVDRQSLLIDSSYNVIVVMRNQLQYGRPAIIFSLRTSLTSKELQERYNLQTHLEANETSELKFWPLAQLSDLLDSSRKLLPITPSCHVAVTAYARLCF